MFSQSFLIFGKETPKKLKKAGRGDTKSYEALTDSQLEKIYKILGHLMNLMELDENDESFQENLLALPEQFWAEYHYLTMYGAMFIVIFLVSCCSSFISFLFANAKILIFCLFNHVLRCFNEIFASVAKGLKD